MLTSSSSFALIGHRTLELYYFIIIYYLFSFNLTVVRGRRSSEGRMKTEEKTKVSEVGFEPGTFRSCVEHSIRYATETPPIPDVLLVLVAPIYINRNGTTTLQSRFNSRTRKKIERRQNENGGENQSVRGGVRTRNLPVMCRALYPLRHGDTADTGRLASAGSS